MINNKVLILGAGLVVKPMVKYLLGKGFKVTVASNTPENAIKMINGHPDGKSVDWSVGNDEMLDKMVAEHNLVVSFLPYVFHTVVAKFCIKNKKDMITASYVKPEMRALDEEARKAGIIILNEVGLDPGIDHMSAMRVIDHIRSKGGHVEEFYSLCGALPAPEAVDNPFAYKFTWSPKGVVMAGNNDAKYLKDGKIIEIPTKNLFKSPVKMNFENIGELEVYPNRDSLSYIDIYGINGVKTMYRGTLRYNGWSEIIDAMKQMNLISYDKISLKGKTYSDFIAGVIKQENKGDLKQKVAEYLGIKNDALPIKALDWLGLFGNVDMKRVEASPFDIISDLMIEKMMLNENERDLVVMQHIFVAAYPEGKKEVIKSLMVDYGEVNGDTSIARTVALPASIGVKLILEGKIKVKGVQVPVIPEIYNPILDELETLNIKMEETFGLPLSEKPV
ncbi:MAG: saccharopine dehydrogenase C-terminal domain-containing protein [Bacteroidota bacterium]|nr:saccharopine dehydrogenase C-terminal domain-containing protein [Bacteroidota bacterium]